MSRLHVIWNRVVLFFRRNTGLKNIIVAAILLELTTGAMYYAAQWAIQRTALEYSISELEAREISYLHDSNPDYLIDDKEVLDTLNDMRRLLMLLAIASLSLITFIVYRASKHLERLRVVSAEKKRITDDLLVAGKIQQSMLPEHHLHLDEVEVVGSQVPAKEVGGDLFDYFVRDEKLFFCIGDVSGKGVPSAMMMAGTHSLFRAASVHENDPAHIMLSINETLCQGTETNMFVTLFIGVLDLPTGHLYYCNAGHNPPIVLTPQPTTLDCEANLPVGVFEDTKYERQEKQLLSGNILFLYSDGLTEAMNDRRQQFGIHRVEEVLKHISEQVIPTEDILNTMSTEVGNFVGIAEQSDDLTMLAIRFTPTTFETSLDETLTLFNDIHQVPELNGFMDSITNKLQLDISLARRLRLAVEEAVVNVMEYAYPTETQGKITVKVMSDGHRLKVVIVDNGFPFDPTLIEKTDTTLSAEERPIGRLGLLLVRELMDSINYERENNQNVLTLIKTIDKK